MDWNQLIRRALPLGNSKIPLSKDLHRIRSREAVPGESKAELPIKQALGVATNTKEANQDLDLILLLWAR